MAPLKVCGARLEGLFKYMVSDLLPVHPSGVAAVRAAGLAAMLVLLEASSLHAQTVALRVGHLIDPDAGTSTANQLILVEAGRITAVGDTVEVPVGADVVDLSESWVLPGLMDAHVHLTTAVRPSADGPDTQWLRESTALRALRGARNARVILDAGFTTVKNVGNDADYAGTALMTAIDRGFIDGPTLLTAGKIIAPFGGQSVGMPPDIGPFWQLEYIDADTPDEIRKAIRRNLYYGANAIKLVSDDQRYYYSEDDIRAAVDEAHRAGVTVAVHVTSDDAARNVVLGGADSIEHGFQLSDDVLRLMKARGTVLVGTDFPTEHFQMLGPAEAADGMAAAAAGIHDRLRRAYDVGVTLVFGTDVIISPPGRTRAEMMLDYLDVWVEAGVPPPAILQAMTTNAARLMKIDAERGRIAPSLAADIIATPENPLENIDALKAVHFVMKGGRVYRNDP